MSQVLDPEVLEMLVEAVGAEATSGIVELFLVECRELTAAIAAPGAERVAIGRAAHSLKSSAGQVGAMALSEAALAVEIAAGDDTPELPSLVAALSRCAAAAEAALSTHLR
ncbi:MAG TPA: Hpt domain-containing protein [Stellaceae bacterium]|nr:Hpt domain-containing protein [Stellaceae bacterium]